MVKVYGIILLEKTEIIIRIYEVIKTEWKLIHYQNYHIPVYESPADTKKSIAEEISTLLATFFTTDNARYVTQWKTGARSISPQTLNYISGSLGLQIENIDFIREQELLCKGLFTELW
jgi:hypothetical protein